MKKRLLITSIVMMLVVAVALSTATYAWFSTNTQVTATGMSITAKTNGAFLQILPKDGNITGTGQSASATTSSATLFPAKYNGTNGSDAWQYAFSASQSSATKTGNYLDVASADVGDYRLKNEFTLKTAQTTAGSSTVSNLVVSSCKVTSASAFLDALSIVVVCGTNVQTISATGQTTATAWDISSPTTLTATVDETGVDVTVYVYFDGDNSVVTSNNATTVNLVGVAVELTFSAS